MDDDDVFGFDRGSDADRRWGDVVPMIETGIESGRPDHVVHQFISFIIIIIILSSLHRDESNRTCMTAFALEPMMMT